MNALWIRVEANEKGSRRVWAMRRALGIPVPHVVGYLTCLGGEIAQHAPDGNVADVEDELLETWAMWDGAPGAFAAAFRAACAPEGRFLGWTETMGELVRRREKDRLRKRTEPKPGGAAEVPRKSAEAPRKSSVRDETRRNETDETSGAEISVEPPARAHDAAPAAAGASSHDERREPDFAPLRAAPLAPLVSRLLRERYRDATAERRRDVARQLAEALTPAGAKLRRGVVVRTTPTTLATAIGLALGERIDNPDRSIFIVLLKCHDGKANLALDAKGRTATEAAAADVRAETAADEREFAQREAAARTWLEQHPDEATEVARRVDLTCPNLPGLAQTRAALTVDLVEQLQAELAGAPR